MLGKVVNGKLVLPSAAEQKKIVITNPTKEALKFNLGYKDLVVEGKPEYDKETQTLKAVFEETSDTLIQRWEVTQKEQ